ncbi:unnamed protein product [Dracunculus medinensis]|uniref:ANK_REP_REGION domain-containing protein n=1 Tax=Dracunculus medinensis TaxID=318479 RepID=A0A0N4U2Y5_DRAME|nr:unnamed protein product [Dracunculus medinensis]
MDIEQKVWCRNGPRLMERFFLRNISEVLEIGIFRRCNAVDDRYGVLYNCFRYANNVYPPKTSQKMVHTNMFIQHRLCFYCNLFCSQIYILVKLSDILFSYNSGKQLNLVSLLCDSSKLLLLNELDRLKSSVVETHICASNNLCFHINSHNFEVPFRWIWHHSILGKEHLENIFILRALKDAIIHNNVNVVLLILQFIDVKIDYDSLEKAIIHVDSILTKILLHHEAPLFSNEDGQMNDILLESVKKKSSAILEELLKFRRLNCYYTSKNVTSDAMLLLLAIKSSWLRGVILLLEYGVNVLAVNERGETALHILASTLSKDVFVVGQAVLRTRQFSPSFINVADHNGLVPLAIAYKKSNWIIARNESISLDVKRIFYIILVEKVGLQVTSWCIDELGESYVERKKRREYGECAKWNSKRLLCFNEYWMEVEVELVEDGGKEGGRRTFSRV